MILNCVKFTWYSDVKNVKSIDPRWQAKGIDYFITWILLPVDYLHKHNFLLALCPKWKLWLKQCLEWLSLFTPSPPKKSPRYHLPQPHLMFHKYFIIVFLNSVYPIPNIIAICSWAAHVRINTFSSRELFMRVSCAI